MNLNFYSMNLNVIKKEQKISCFFSGDELFWDYCLSNFWVFALAGWLSQLYCSVTTYEILRRADPYSCSQSDGPTLGWLVAFHFLARLFCVPSCPNHHQFLHHLLSWQRSSDRLSHHHSRFHQSHRSHRRCLAPPAPFPHRNFHRSHLRCLHHLSLNRSL